MRAEKVDKRTWVWALLAIVLFSLLGGFVIQGVSRTLGVTILRCKTCGKNCTCPVLPGNPRCACYP